MYIQEISVAVTAPDKGTASEIIKEAFAEINPYNSASGRAAILAATSDIIWLPQGSEDYSTGERVIEWEMAPVY